MGARAHQKSFNGGRSSLLPISDRPSVRGIPICGGEEDPPLPKLMFATSGFYIDV